MVSFLAIAGAVKAAPSRPIVLFDVPISIAIPDGYVDASVDKGLPENNALFLTEAIEPWEAAAEFDEAIFFYGLGLKPSTETIKQQKFDEIFGFVRKRIDAQIAGKTFEMPEASINIDLINSIYRLSHGKNARAIEVTDDRQDRKALLIDTGFELPGVVMYPIIEEISFIRVKDRIVIFHATRVDTSQMDQVPALDKNVRAHLMATGAEVRNALVSVD